MDYRELLKKYIDHVAREEGVTFLKGIAPYERFTREEWDELQRLATEADEEASGKWVLHDFWGDGIDNTMIVARGSEKREVHVGEFNPTVEGPSAFTDEQLAEYKE